jgi:hypothetical protein
VSVPTPSTGPSRVLVVIDRTAATPALLGAVRARNARGGATFHVIVPHGAHGYRHVPDPSVGAHRALEASVAKVTQVTRHEATGEIGDSSPLTAIKNAIDGAGADEIILSTVPGRVARLVRRDLPRRVRSLGLPVTHVEA